MSEIHCFYISAGLLTPHHVARIGDSIWEFLWLISHETRMEGKVLNGSPITLSRIAQELGESLRTARRHLNQLSKAGYVKKQRLGPGHIYSYSIAHSKKWQRQFVAADKNGRSQSGAAATNDRRVRTNLAAGADKSGRTNKEDRQVEQVDNKSTICTKCGGRTIYERLVPSEKDPDKQVTEWVKCDVCGLDS